jgi:hypothetical protein
MSESAISVRVILIFTLLAAVTGSTAAVSSGSGQMAAKAAAEQPYDWTAVGGTSGAEVRDGQRFALRNRTHGKAIYYSERRFGINLKWRDASAGSNVWFKRMATGGGAVQYGERLAIGVDRGGYLKYGNRTYGINLVWSSSPAYEWEIRGRIGVGSVRFGQEIALYNRTYAKNVVYGDRVFGINLIWWPIGTPTSTATVSHRVRTGPYADPGNLRCTGRVDWQFEPVTLTGSTGQNTTQTFSRSYETTATLESPNTWYCVFYTLTGNFRVGTWRITAQTPVWRTSCEVSLRAGNQIVNFTQNRASCRTGFFDWP